MEALNKPDAENDKFQAVPLEEAVELAALDSEFYSHYFFPKTCRQRSPQFHKDVWELLEDPAERYVAIKIHRDGAKTTLLRLFCSKRIAYGISRTILYVGKSETAAMKSIDWLRRAVEFNYAWAGPFQLRKGKQWSGSEIDIYHEGLDISVRIIAIGITGSTRGINVDDYRPDLIIVDDPCDEENTGTPEQRTKIEELFFGSLYQSLSPATDSPEAKMVLLQTPLDEEDLIEKAMKDPGWASLSFSCFTTDGTESSWPSRYPFETLMKEKEMFIARNQLTLWLREKEVTVVSSELSHFKASWLKYWEIAPEQGSIYMGIDPTPPPKDTTTVKRTAKLDDAVVMVIRIYKGDAYVLEYYCAKSPQPDEFVNKIFEFIHRYRPRRIGCETTLFQRMLKWYLELEMKKRQSFVQIIPVEDKRKKETRISQQLSGRASQGALIVHKTHAKLIEQFTKFPYTAHDDVIDALSIALSVVNLVDLIGDNDYIDGEYEDVTDRYEDDWRGAP